MISHHLLINSYPIICCFVVSASLFSVWSYRQTDNVNSMSIAVIESHALLANYSASEVLLSFSASLLNNSLKGLLHIKAAIVFLVFYPVPSLN